MDKWTELRTAYQVAKLGTVSAASQVLGLHRATVNRHIDVLEAEIGTKIFIRHARGYALTEVGQEVLRVAQKTEELIDDLAGRVQGGKSRVEGEIKLTILAPFAVFLLSAIQAFRDRNPNCRVDVHVGEGLAKLEYGEAHIALCAGSKPEHPDYVVSPFGPVSFNLYAHDGYIARQGLPKDDDMRGHLFALLQLPEGRSPFASWVKENVPPEAIALVSSDFAVTNDAITSGLGIGFMSDLDARKRGALTALFPVNPDWAVALWLVTHVDLHRTEKVQEMLHCMKVHLPREFIGATDHARAHPG